MPEPSALQFGRFQRAMFAVSTVPALVKVPPTIRSLPCHSSALTHPPTPPPTSVQRSPSQRARPRAGTPAISEKAPPTKSWLLRKLSAKTTAELPLAEASVVQFMPSHVRRGATVVSKPKPPAYSFPPPEAKA